MLALVLLAGTAALAGERETVLQLRVADLESQGRCDEAIAAARSGRAEGVVDAQVDLVEGRCLVRQQRYPEAILVLTAAKQRPPTPADVDLHLGVAHFQLGEVDAAASALDEARTAGASGPLLDLYTGLILLQREQAREGALALERARRADPRSVEPAASYYAFLAWRSLEDEERAQAALERLRETDPDGPWIAEAERLIERSQRPRGLRTWGAVEAGMEYDSNVVLRGDIASSQRDISDDDDGRGYWAADAGVEFFRNEQWSVGALASYSGTAHFQRTRFDTQYPVGSVFLDRRFGETSSARLRYDYGYGWVDYEPYLSAHTVTGTFVQGFEEWGTTELLLSGFWYDFREHDPKRVPQPAASGSCSDLERDGEGVTTGAAHRYWPGYRDLELRAGYSFLYYASSGCEHDSKGHQVLGGFELSLPLELRFDAFATFTFQDFDARSGLLQQNERRRHRRDRIWRTGAGVERPITDRLSWLTQYTYVDTGSNTKAYDYDRHVVGTYLRMRFY